MLDFSHILNKNMSRFRRGSNSRPSACKADVITTTLRNPSYRPCTIYCINSNTLHIYWDLFHTIFIKTIFFTLRSNQWNSKFYQRLSNDRLFIHWIEFTVSCKENFNCHHKMHFYHFLFSTDIHDVYLSSLVHLFAIIK